VPVDFSEASRHSVEQAVAIAGWYRARLTALHVYSPIFMPVPALPPPVERVPASELERVREELTTFVQAAPASGVGVDVVVDVGQPAALILECAATLHADLMVMGTHGKSGFEHLNWAR
jgi:nucleotide-binding universal stress UspA family protein